MEHVFDEDRPALNPDGTLKDAKEIEWLHSPSEAIPKLAVAEPDSPTLGIKKLSWISSPELIREF